jgi:hypothetical protein
VTTDNDALAGTAFVRRSGVRVRWADLETACVGRSREDARARLRVPHLVGLDRGQAVAWAVRKRPGSPWSGLVTIGRAPDTDITLIDDRVSRVHAFIHKVGVAWRVTDPGSLNGTLVDGRRIPSGKTLELPSGAQLWVGGVRFVFLDVDALIERLSAETSAAHRGFPQAGLGAAA